LPLLIGLLLASGPVRAQLPSGRSTVQVPVRDGVMLATDIYLPAGEGPWPVALARTPYDKNDFRSGGGHGGVAPARFTNGGIVLVVQDVRGRGASPGRAQPAFADAKGERQDGADTVAWIRQQPWCNGKIATFGGSYPGMTQLALAGAGPEGIVGQYVRAAPSSLYHTWVFQNGVYRKGWVDGWLQGTGWPAVVRQTWQQHPYYDDYWRDQDLGAHAEQVRWPMLFVAGWFDVFSQGTIEAFTQVQERGGEGARGRQHLVIGPWDHAIWAGAFPRAAGQLTFPVNASRPGSWTRSRGSASG
jgi:predicted acyl esterase